MTRARHVHDILNRLAADEERFLTNDFLAPVPGGGQVQVRIAHVVCRLGVDPTEFIGWGIFRPNSYTSARLVRPAGLAERQRYLELFPKLSVILCGRRRDQWLAIPAHQSDGRFRIRGALPVRLVDEAQLFEVVFVRFDGMQCWFERLDDRRDPAAAAYLRQALAAMVEPDRLHRPALTPEERAAYTQSYETQLEARRDRTEQRLRNALAHAGAELRGYAERPDGYRIEYEVDGERHVSAVGRDDLGVLVAGVCLSGEDQKFDLQSLVGVLREGAGGVLRIGADNGGVEEDQYWHIHPRRPG